MKGIKRFAVYAGDRPEGGALDLVLETDDLDKAMRAASSTEHQWSHIHDRLENKVEHVYTYTYP